MRQRHKFMNVKGFKRDNYIFSPIILGTCMIDSDWVYIPSLFVHVADSNSFISYHVEKLKEIELSLYIKLNSKFKILVTVETIIWFFYYSNVNNCFKTTRLQNILKNIISWKEL